jgi:hypothetical protein
MAVVRKGAVRPIINLSAPKGSFFNDISLHTVSHKEILNYSIVVAFFNCASGGETGGGCGGGPEAGARTEAKKSQEG